VQTSTHLVEEFRFTVRYNRDSITLHSEDIFWYGVTGMYPNQVVVEELFRAALNVEGVRHVRVSHGAFASVASAPALLPFLS
jgi:hypothetical protein